MDARSQPITVPPFAITLRDGGPESLEDLGAYTADEHYDDEVAALVLTFNATVIR
jgi:hypothetical protein